MSEPVKVTNADYRAIIAGLWTLLTGAIVLLGIYKSYSIQDIGVLLIPFITLDTVFINAYFKSKE